MRCMVIFDCDGVLVDSEGIGSRVMAEMAVPLGLRLSDEEALERFRGRKVATCVEEIEALIGDPVPEGFVKEFRQRCADRFRAELRPVPGIADLLGELDMPFCVASSAPLDKIRLVLDLCGLLHHFEGRIFSAYEIGCWKPDPGLFLHAAHALGVAPADCVVVEDSLVGVQAARAAGMAVFAYVPDFASGDPADSPLASAGATVFDRMERLPALLDAWRGRRLPAGRPERRPEDAGTAHAGVLERLQRASPDAEIWLDAPPSLFGPWAERMVAGAPAAKREIWRTQLGRLFDPGQPERSIVRGATTNPNLIALAILGEPERWGGIVNGLMDQHPEADAERIYWMMYQEAVRMAAEALLPLWSASGGKFGWVSGQLDPRWMFDTNRMVEYGLGLAARSPNVMVKIPGTVQGYRAVRLLASRGISINGTFSYTVPQFVAFIRAIEEGRAEADSAGLDLSRWRAVVTHMIGRFGAQGDLADQAEHRGISLSLSDIRWAEIAILKRVQQLVSYSGTPVRMLLSSLKVDPPVPGGPGPCWHLEKTAGSGIVYTCRLDFIAALMEAEDRFGPFDPASREESPPPDVLDRLLRLPYFERAYDPDGLSPEEFAHHGAFVATSNEAARSARRMVDFVARHFQRHGRSPFRRPLTSQAAAE